MRSTSVLLASVACGVLAAPVLAQEAPKPPEAAQDGGIEDIVVTAQKREQNLQNVPLAVTALSAEALQTKGITQFQDLASASPGLTVTQGSNPTSSSINLRGIGTSAFSIGVEPSVAVVVDDVAVLQQAQAFSNLSDIERVEVLRGPQGTLFGKNASAGAINIVTKAPTSVLSGHIGLTATTDEEYRVEASISGPLGAGVGFRVNGFYGDRKGYIDNLTNGTRLGNDRSWGLRGRLTADLSSTLSIALTADHSETRTNGVPRTFLSVPTGSTLFGAPLSTALVGITPGPSNYVVRANNDPANRNFQTSVIGKATLDLGPVKLISVTSYQDWAFNFFEDVDATDINVLGIPGGLVQNSPFHARQFAQELRLVSNTPGPLQYLFGLYYSDGKTDRSFTRGPAGPLLSAWTASAGTRSYAAFGQASYDVTATTHVDAGIRFNREKIDVAFQNLIVPATPPAGNATCLATCTGNASDDHVTGKISLRQDLAPRVMAYASYATGYKGQGYDVSSGFTPGRAAAPVKPETSQAYEVGLKSRFLDNHVQLNVALFLTDYNNFQAQSAIVLPSGALQLGLNNVGRLRTKGVEVELSVKPVRGLSFDFSAAYTDAIIREFPTANCYAGQTAAQGCVDPDGAGPLPTFQNLAGKRLANAPEFKYTASLAYETALPGTPFDGFVTLDYRHQSAVNYDLFQNPLTVQGSFGILNGSIGIKESADQRYRVTLFVNNLFDRSYATNIALAPGASADVLGQVQPRDSRRYFGIRVGYNF